MRNVLFAFLLAPIMLYASPAYSEELSASEIEQQISGNRLLLATKWGVEFPLVYATDGKVTGDGTGTGIGKYFAPKETGKWWITGNQVCQKFPTWYDGRTSCFTLKKTGTNTFIWKRQDGRSGTARIG